MRLEDDRGHSHVSYRCSEDRCETVASAKCKDSSFFQIQQLLTTSIIYIYSQAQAVKVSNQVAFLKTLTLVCMCSASDPHLIS